MFLQTYGRRYGGNYPKASVLAKKTYGRGHLTLAGIRGRSHNVFEGEA